MEQCLYYIGGGGVELRAVEDAGPPAAREVLIRTRLTLISPGTELAILTGAHRKVRSGLLHYPVKNWGYSCVGTIEAAGGEVEQFQVGDRVVYTLEGSHASRVRAQVNGHLLQSIPDGLDDEAAVFASLGKIALHGVRQAGDTLGYPTAVVGLGLVGNLCAQILKLGGATPLAALELAEARMEIARACGLTTFLRADAADLDPRVAELTSGKGFRRVFEATGVAAGLMLAFRVASRRARAILMSGLHLPGEIDLYTDFQMKEISLVAPHQPKCPATDEPYNPYTQQENLALVLHWLRAGALVTAPLITHQFRARAAQEAYDLLRLRKENVLGVILDWT